MWSYIALSHTMELVGKCVHKGLVVWVLGRGSWVVKFSGFLTYILSYRHTCGTTNFNWIINKK